MARNWKTVDLIRQMGQQVGGGLSQIGGAIQDKNKMAMLKQQYQDKLIADMIARQQEQREIGEVNRVANLINPEIYPQTPGADYRKTIGQAGYFTERKGTEKTYKPDTKKKTKDARISDVRKNAKNFNSGFAKLKSLKPNELTKGDINALYDELGRFKNNAEAIVSTNIRDNKIKEYKRLYNSLQKWLFENNKKLLPKEYRKKENFSKALKSLEEGLTQRHGF